jgi:hypothetical protein
MKVVLAVLLGLLAAACAAAPAQPLSVADPANADAPAPPVRHRSSLENYVSQRPVDPVPWTEQNQRVAPRPKQ